PPAESLARAFEGAQAWFEREPPDAGIPPGCRLLPPQVLRYDPKKAADGYTLFTSFYESRATLLDMRGNEVYHWDLPFSSAFPSATKPPPDDRFYWFGARLFPNGDLLVVYQAEGVTPYGFGLAKLDKYSRVLWTFADNVHHDVDVGDDGRIYTL